MPDQPDYDFAEEVAIATESLRLRIAKRIDAGDVEEANRAAMRLGQYKLREAYLEFMKVARAPRTKAGGGSAG